MPETSAVTLNELAGKIRTKNAGPFWLTVDLFMRDEDGYRVVADETFFNEVLIGDLYQVDPSAVQIFRVPTLNIVKISFPRPITQGSLHDRDMHGGQHHAPLALLRVPGVMG
jgi:hypothetical protein